MNKEFEEILAKLNAAAGASGHAVPQPPDLSQLTEALNSLKTAQANLADMKALVATDPNQLQPFKITYCNFFGENFITTLVYVLITLGLGDRVRVESESHLGLDYVRITGDLSAPERSLFWENFSLLLDSFKAAGVGVK